MPNDNWITVYSCAADRQREINWLLRTRNWKEIPVFLIMFYLTIFWILEANNINESKFKKLLKIRNPESIKEIKDDYINTVAIIKSYLLACVKRQHIIQTLKQILSHLLNEIRFMWKNTYLPQNQPNSPGCQASFLLFTEVYNLCWMPVVPALATGDVVSRGLQTDLSSSRSNHWVWLDSKPNTEIDMKCLYFIFLTDILINY